MKDDKINLLQYWFGNKYLELKIKRKKLLKQLKEGEVKK